MRHVVMLVTNSYSHDPRVRQEAAALLQAGFAVTVLAWDRLGQEPARETMAGVTVHRCGVVSGYGLGMRQMAYLPRFWWWAIRLGRSLRPDVVHSHDLDTLPAGLLLSRLSRCPVLFDAHEHFPSSLNGRVPRWFVRLVESAEKWLVRRTDTVITVGRRLQHIYQKAGARRVVVVGNYKDAADFHLDRAERAHFDHLLQLPPGRIICYLGGLSESRAILSLLDAAAGLPGINVIVAGWGPLSEAVRKRCARSPNLRYLGRIPPEEVAPYTAYSDAVYYVLEPGYANNHFSAPNKLFEAIAAGKPVICTAGVGEIGDIVAAGGCGIVVPSSDRSALTRALFQLQDDTLYHRLAMAARQMYAGGYSWQTSQQVLLNLYSELIFQGCMW